jgi:hypothetical protein
MNITPTTVSTHPKITVATDELLNLDLFARRPTSAGRASAMIIPKSYPPNEDRADRVSGRASGQNCGGPKKK